MLATITRLTTTKRKTNNMTMTKAEIQKLNDDMERLSKSHAELLVAAKIVINSGYVNKYGHLATFEVVSDAIKNAEKVAL